MRVEEFARVRAVPGCELVVRWEFALGCGWGRAAAGDGVGEREGEEREDEEKGGWETHFEGLWVGVMSVG